MEAISKGWVFSRNKDLFIFLGPVLFGIFLTGIFKSDADISHTILYFLLVESLANTGHIGATALPIFFDKKISKTLSHRLWILPVVAMAIFYVGIYFSRAYFWHLLAGFTVYHIAMQQYGFFKISNRRFGDIGKFQIPKKLENLLILNLFIFPIYFWLTRQSAVTLKWFAEGDLGVGWPQYYRPEFQIIYFILLVSYFLLQLYPLVRKEPINLARFALTISTVGWYYGGLVVAKTPLYFIAVSLLIHGISYIIFCRTYWLNSNKYEPKRWLRKITYLNMIFFFSVLVGFAILWNKILEIFINADWLLPLLWIPLIAHFMFDSVIWRSGFMKILPANSSGSHEGRPVMSFESTIEALSGRDDSHRAV